MADLDVPRQDVLDNKLAKEKPKRTARPPSRNTSVSLYKHHVVY